MKVLGLALSLMVHAGILAMMSRLEGPPEKKSSVVSMRVTRPPPPAPPPPPPPVDEVVPPPEVVPKKVKRRTAKKIVKDTPPPTAPPTKPPPPKFAFSVDMSSTVNSGKGPAVPTVDGGGNMFADPARDAALPKGKNTAPTPPPSGTGKEGPPDAYQITAEPKFLTAENDRAPPYPDAAKAQELEGTVLLRVYVAESGKVTRVKVVRPLGGGCTEAAVKWAKTRWRFEPAKAGPDPVGMWINVPVRFVLER